MRWVEFSDLHAGRIMRFSPREQSHLAKIFSFPITYVLEINSRFNVQDSYATMVHELAHLYCGHLGQDELAGWHDRSHLSHIEKEIEAESVCFLVCHHLGITTKSDQYLADYVARNPELPGVSLMTILEVTGRIEEMGQRILPPHKPKKAKQLSLFESDRLARTT